MRRVLILVAALTVVVAACGDSAEDTSPTTTAAPGTDDDMVVSTAGTTESLPPDTGPEVEGGTVISASSGGAVTSEDGLLTLDIPAGALAEDTAIAIVQLEPGDVETGDAIVVGTVSTPWSISTFSMARKKTFRRCRTLKRKPA